MTFIRLAKIFFPLSVILVVTSLVLLAVPGPKLSIEFTGGTLIEVKIPAEKNRDDLLMALRSFTRDGDGLEAISLSRTKTETYFVRTENLSNDDHQSLILHLEKTLGDVQELQYTTIGPTVGQNLKKRAFFALAAATVAIVLYIALAFRKVPKSLSPWTFGVSAIIALVHDITITLGIFTILSYHTTFQVDTLFVSALLSIMGYSVSDTIVIFDRIRDNLSTSEGKRDEFAAVAQRSLVQSLSRTLNTGLGALIMLFALFFWGAESIRWFILALIVGTVIGTYSSFFIATPLLVFRQRKS